MTDSMRIDSKDLQFVMKDTGGAIVHINARGWMELHDLENLYLFVSESIQRRRPTPETVRAPEQSIVEAFERSPRRVQEPSGEPS